MVRHELRDITASTGNHSGGRVLFRSAASASVSRFTGSTQQPNRTVETMRQVQGRLFGIAVPVAAFGKGESVNLVLLSGS